MATVSFREIVTVTRFVMVLVTVVVFTLPSRSVATSSRVVV